VLSQLPGAERHTGDYGSVDGDVQDAADMTAEGATAIVLTRHLSTLKIFLANDISPHFGQVYALLSPP